MRRRTAVVLLGAALALASCRAGAPDAPDGASPVLRFEDQHGELHAPLAPAPGRVHVIVFTTTECPIANGYAPELRSIHEDYAGDDLSLLLVHVDPFITRELAAEHAGSYGYPMPILLDPEQALVRATGATITPEAVVVTDDGRQVYRGRIDDWYAALGRKRRFASTRELRDAIEAALTGEEVTEPRTRAVGCLMPDLP